MKVGDYIKTFFKRLSITLAACSVFIFSAIGYFAENLPDRFSVNTGQNFSIENPQLTAVSNGTGDSQVSAAQNSKASTVKFMGLIPVKTVSVQEVSEVLLIPSGNPFGVKMFTAGAMVVGITDIATDSGDISPGKSAGINVGDVILSVNKKEISRNEEVKIIIETSDGEPLLFKIKRGEQIFETMLTPAISSIDNSFKSGIWVRDSAAGIGTITFIDPQTNAFAGLGHGVCDVDTGEILPIGSGEVCDVDIHNIHKGIAGTPGELIGVFASDTAIGSISQNNTTGIYGKLFGDYSSCESFPMAHKQDVKLGNASVICAITADEQAANIKNEYAIEITSLDYNEKNKVKNMIIKVTDPALLALTGGIVQGMSGTPILQHNKLVGAVTHVFINNPEKGYGIFAENMYEYAQQIS